jgi:hypothetical protein
MRRRIPDDVYRWGRATSLVPVAVFALSIPIAFLNTTVAACSWLLAIPAFRIAERRKPARADEFLRR